MLHHPTVSPKLARFLTFFSQFEFVLHHVKGRLNVVADALSRPAQSPVEDDDRQDSEVIDEEKFRLPTVHDCDERCAHVSSSFRCHSVNAATIRLLPDHEVSLLLDDQDFRGRAERRKVGECQELWMKSITSSSMYPMSTCRQ
ncbi:TPA: hypothetical protein N0F65_006716 [Lagenidium giganteum]|uniref:Uncharacterized protein n=1 Tax=Lagenidium giganteum TaxID=4803 RepID=A0AAV2Z9P7_9STRA|nr:TPA: hypothetical protein N0F65_006716 [Lagenidium giganteum]